MQQSEFARSVDAFETVARQQHCTEDIIAYPSWDQPEGRPVSPKVIAKIDALLAVSPSRSLRCLLDAASNGTCRVKSESSSAVGDVYSQLRAVAFGTDAQTRNRYRHS